MNRRIRQVSSKAWTLSSPHVDLAVSRRQQIPRSARDDLLLTDVALEFNFKGVNEVKPERLEYITGTIKQLAQPPDQ